jgi:hypothetical protein
MKESHQKVLKVKPPEELRFLTGGFFIWRLSPGNELCACECLRASIQRAKYLVRRKNKMGPTIFFLILFLILNAVLSLFFAVILQQVAKWIAKFRPTYSDAYKATFIGVLVTAVVAVVFCSPGPSGMIGILQAVFIIGFFVHTPLYSRCVKHPEMGSIGIVKTCIISLLVVFLECMVVSFLYLIFIWSTLRSGGDLM